MDESLTPQETIVDQEKLAPEQKTNRFLFGLFSHGSESKSRIFMKGLRNLTNWSIVGMGGYALSKHGNMDVDNAAAYMRIAATFSGFAIRSVEEVGKRLLSAASDRLGAKLPPSSQWDGLSHRGLLPDEYFFLPILQMFAEMFGGAVGESTFIAMTMLQTLADANLRSPADVKAALSSFKHPSEEQLAAAQLFQPEDSDTTAQN